MTGNSTGSRLWRPMATFLRLRPWVTWSFSCIWMMLLMRGSSNSTFFTTAVTNHGRTPSTFFSTVTLYPASSTSYRLSPFSSPVNVA